MFRHALYPHGAFVPLLKFHKGVFFKPSTGKISGEIRPLRELETFPTDAYLRAFILGELCVDIPFVQLKGLKSAIAPRQFLIEA